MCVFKWCSGGCSGTQTGVPTSLQCRCAGNPTDMREKEISVSHSASYPHCSVSCCHLCTVVSSEVNFQTAKEWEENGNGDEFLQTDHMTFSMYFLLSILESADNLSLVLVLATGFLPGLYISVSLLSLFHVISSPLWTVLPSKGRVGKQLHTGLPEHEWSILAVCLFLSTIFCQSVGKKVWNTLAKNSWEAHFLLLPHHSTAL